MERRKRQLLLAAVVVGILTIVVFWRYYGRIKRMSALPSNVEVKGLVAVATIPRPNTIRRELPVGLGGRGKNLDVGELRAVHKNSSIGSKPMFVTSIIRDLSGNIWFGTEDFGVYRYNPSTGKWARFTTVDGLGDDNGYALGCDHRGRIWVGHLNHGLSVYNGQKWQNYDVVGGIGHADSLSGPIGERVFAIKISPTDGDVWIATSAGLSRYSERSSLSNLGSEHNNEQRTIGTWSYYTRAEGLPSDVVSAIAFDQKGNIYLGTQCDGILMADASNQYEHWRQVSGPDRAPIDPAGEGLPTNLINDILVAHDGAVYAATTTGLAISKDHGQNWHYVRGGDWADKVRGRYGGPPQGWTERAGATLLEDYVTCLAEDEVGKLYVGYRRMGWEQFDPTTTRHVSAPPAHGGALAAFVTSILPTSAGDPVLGSYGGGPMGVPWHYQLTPRLVAPAASLAPAELPSPATPPKEEALRREYSSLESGKNFPAVVPLPDDWRTQGDWLGRYGRYWACLCSMDYPEYIWGAGPESIDYSGTIGPNHETGDGLRHWVHALYTTNPKSLEMPPVYLDSRIVKGLTTPNIYRRQSEWDDHGEAYPLSHEGPDVYCTISAPPGLFYLSLYDMNKDGHLAGARFRDYCVSVREHSRAPLDDISRFDQKPDLAHSRIRDFWGGVYKRFLVHGPLELTIRVQSNNSHDTILAAVFLDQVNERPLPYFDSSFSDHVGPIPVYAFGRRFFVEQLRGLRPEEENKSGLFASGCYQTNFFKQWEDCQRRAGFTPARDIERALRWDQRIPAYSGRGYETVKEYLARNGRSKSGN